MRRFLQADDAGFARRHRVRPERACLGALSAPVELDRHAVYPVDNFGSAMSPLYTTLALWIGALLMMVTLKVNPSQRTVRELDNPTPQQLFIGRFGVVALLSLAPEHADGIGQFVLPGRPGEQPVPLHAVFLGVRVGVRLHHLHPGGILRQFWQGAERVFAGHSSFWRRRKLSLCSFCLRSCRI